MILFKLKNDSVSSNNQLSLSCLSNLAEKTVGHSNLYWFINLA